MRRCRAWGIAFGSVLFFASAVHAQCAKDTDCKGDRVCEAGACRAPAVAPVEDANGWGVGTAAQPAEAGGHAAASTTDKPQPATPPVARTSTRSMAPRSGATLEMREPSADVEQRPVKRKTERHSVGMMAAGIVMVSISPIPLLAGMIYSVEGMACRSSNLAIDGSDYDDGCDGYETAAIGLTLTSLALIGAGVPLIVIGGKRVPAKEPWRAEISPYATPDGVGFGLRLKL
jgi:hypothetical protein